VSPHPEPSRRSPWSWAWSAELTVSAAARFWGRSWSAAGCRSPGRTSRTRVHVRHLHRRCHHLRAAGALVAPGDVAPNRTVGLACGLGGLLGGYIGARLQLRLSGRGLRLLLGVLATGLATLYLLQTTVTTA
jgi:hypothetical protein